MEELNIPQCYYDLVKNFIKENPQISGAEFCNTQLILNYKYLDDCETKKIDRGDDYDKLLEDFIKKNPEKNERDFINKQIKIFEKLYTVFKPKPIDINAHYYELRDNYIKKNPNKRESQFVAETIHNYKKNIDDFERLPITEQFTAEYKRHHLIQIKKYYNYFLDKQRILIIEALEFESSEIDYSKLKGTEKIILLQKLGILSVLMKQTPFNTSVNALATTISWFTGENASTVQSYINPVYSSGVDQKNNPLLNEKKVKMVTQKLLNIGFNPQD